VAQRIIRVAEVAQVRFMPMDLLVDTPGEIAERLAKGDYFIAGSGKGQGAVSA
jgi:hypothetical protein